MSFKKTIKQCVGSLCESQLILPVLRKLSINTNNVAYYHYVGESVPYYQAFYSGCTAQKFSHDLKYLSRIFEFASLAEVLACTPGQADDSRPLLAITFDDGFDLVKNQELMEIMNQYHIKATSFVITSCIGNRRMMWRHQLSAIQSLVGESIWRSEYNKLASLCGFQPAFTGENLLKASSRWDMAKKDEWANLLWERCQLPPLADYLAENKPYMDWDGLEQWMAAGHTVGFHTHTHPYCSRLAENDLGQEIINPATNLMEQLKIKELPLSYPFGDRFQPELEKKLFAKKIFNAFFGVKGFSLKTVSHDKLERVGVEGAVIGERVLRSHVTARLI
jgi:peptidoglycan/xylan/chitin deacetylase (PgdA/CDA1 family)